MSHFLLRKENRLRYHSLAPRNDGWIWSLGTMGKLSEKDLRDWAEEGEHPLSSPYPDKTRFGRRSCPMVPG